MLLADEGGAHTQLLAHGKGRGLIVPADCVKVPVEDHGSDVVLADPGVADGVPNGFNVEAGGGAAEDLALGRVSHAHNGDLVLQIVQRHNKSVPFSLLGPDFFIGGQSGRMVISQLGGVH